MDERFTTSSDIPLIEDRICIHTYAINLETRMNELRIRGRGPWSLVRSMYL